MTKLVQKISLILLTLLFSACSFDSFNNQNAQIDASLERVNYNSIKSISDIRSIAFEWKKVNDSKVIGYNLYRMKANSASGKLSLIKTIKSKYVTHFVDKNLTPNTKYIYQISSIAKNNIESKTTKAYFVKTLPRAIPVSFVQAISNLPKRIKIIWKPHEDLRIKYYKIEKKEPHKNTWKYLTTKKGRLQSEYIEKNLGDNQSFSYRIIAYTFNGIPTKASQVVTATTKPLPLAPQNVKATRNQPKQITVSWEPSQTKDVVKYVVYRSPFKAIGYMKKTEVNANTLKFIDKISEDGKDYFYKITSVDEDGLESSSDMEPMRGITLNKPATPIVNLAQIQGNKAILNWSSIDDRIVSYNIYKKTKINFWEYKAEKFINIKDLRFEDNNIKKGVVYKYSIQAKDKFGILSDKTDEVELILPKTKKGNLR
ncbi:MAG: fibronectin type III domain-containing protein [Arcobacter sp.]|nr:fibronectin type III domain-containing protein [Arcobacter sp.]